MRMFVAVIPPTEILEGLAAFVEPRREADGPLRWTHPDQWHLTLAFMASVTDHRLDELTDRLERAAVRRSPFDARIGGGGAFPHVARARVLWLGVSAVTAERNPSDELTRLTAGSRAAAGKAGIDVGAGRFRPHLTMARFRVPVDATRWIRVLDAYAGSTWTVEEIVLIESHLGEGAHGRPRYESRGTFALGVGAVDPTRVAPTLPTP